MLINFARASENIVSCAGDNCEVCSILETVNNLYNFILVTGFSVAVLVLILAGSEYIISGGNPKIFSQAKRFLKSGILGFVFLLTGWILVHAVINVTGFNNSTLWWNFECQNSEHQSFLGKDIQNSFGDLISFGSLEEFIKSRELAGKIEGDLDADTLLKQLYQMEEGQSINFLMPNSLGSSEDSEKTLSSFLTVKKEGGEVDLESTGDYVDVLGDNLSLLLQNKEARESLSEENLSILEKYLAGSNNSGNSLLGEDEEILSASNIDKTSSLYSSLAESLKSIKNSETGEDNSDLLTKSPAELLAMALTFSKENEGQNQEDKMMAILLAETLKMSSMLGVEKQNKNTVSFDEEDWNLFNTNSNSNSNRNNNSNENKNSNNNLNVSLEKKKLNCENSGGVWQASSSLLSLSNYCGGVVPDNESSTEEGYSCQCQEDRCVGDSGTCLNKGIDEDSDGIDNEEDKCPQTLPSEKNLINKNRGVSYGCGCSDLLPKKKNCPTNKCEGDYLLVYPQDNQVCTNGSFQAYSCQILRREESDVCKDENSQNNSNNNSSANQNAGSGKPNSGKKIEDNFSKKPKDPSLPPGSGDNGSNTERGNGTVEAIKKALKRIEEKDPLRYEMIMRFTHTIRRTSFPGGMCYGCGYFDVNASLPLGIMDQVIIHEATHSAHDCLTGWGSIPRTERIAVANECGSLCREENPDMVEFPKQKQGITYKGKEVRGYAARFQTKVAPRGTLGTNAFRDAIAYAFMYQDRTEGPYKYGDCESKIIIGMRESEEDVIKKAMTSTRNCFSKPTSDLPKVEACESAKKEIIIK